MNSDHELESHQALAEDADKGNQLVGISTLIAVVFWVGLIGWLAW